jgi:nicotinate-nucleotide adenylyltransferase
VKIGIFGGTFDPPHLGHFLAAVDAADGLELDRVIWLPAARQPLKGGDAAAPAHRLAMASLAAALDPRFAVDPMELERGGLSFMVDSLRAFRERHQDAALFLLLGTDAATLLPKWRDPETIRALAEVVVLTRVGGEDEGAPLGVRTLPTRRVDISATEIRARVKAGRSIRGFVTDGVAAYIAANGLYR